jgi:uncharacterized membrane protein YedE/YeeE
MTTPSRFDVVSFAAGLLFAIGLAVGGMVDPAKVLGFLDVAGDWDPSLLLVMLGAIAAYAPLRALIVRRSGTRQPPPSPIDRRLLLGAALFGIGWGLVGYCPGPAIVSLASLHETAVTAALAMFAGMMLFSWWTRRDE